MYHALLIEPVAGEALQRAYTLHIPTAEQVAALPARSPVSYIDDSTAVINVRGVLTPAVDIIALLVGGGNTTYTEIREAVQAADADPTVASITLDIDSPGGSVRGLFETLDVLRATRKPVNARVSYAASAAYAIAAVTGKIDATSEAASVGSVGVATTYVVHPYAVDIASTNAPAKRPDVRTDRGRAMAREHLDQLHELLVERIAAGRLTTTSRVDADFGRGGVLTAREALRRGMIDSIAGSTVVRGPVSEADQVLAMINAAKAKATTVGTRPSDLKDEVVAIMEQRRNGGRRTASQSVGGRDLGDAVADAMEARRGKGAFAL